MNLADEAVGFRDNHGARNEFFAARTVAPHVPKTGDRRGRRAVVRREVPGLLAARRVLPLVISRYRNEAPIALERLAKERLVPDRLGAR